MSEQRMADIQIVGAFGAVLEREPPDLTLIYDEKRLPFAKIEIQKALFRLLAGETDPKLRSTFQMALWLCHVTNLASVNHHSIWSVCGDRCLRG